MNRRYSDIERVSITPGSKADFWVDLEDEVTGRPIPVDGYLTAKAVFCNCDGEKVEIILDNVNDSGKCGSLFIQIPSVETAKFDEKSVNFDLVFEDIDSETTIIPVNNMLEIFERNC